MSYISKIKFKLSIQYFCFLNLLTRFSCIKQQVTTGIGQRHLELCVLWNRHLNLKNGCHRPLGTYLIASRKVDLKQ